MSRSKQSLSNYQLTTCDMGQLVPIMCLPVLPGDTIGQHTNILLRVTPLAAPVMHQVDVRVHHFFVANRTIWSGWEDFITGGEDGFNTATIPTISPGFEPFGLADYLGVPAGTVHLVNALPFRAYNSIFNEFYRDQDLTTLIPETNQVIQRISWEKDYLSTARPWSQKGPQVSIPVGDMAVVKSDAGEGLSIDVYSTNDAQYRLQDASGVSVAMGAGTGDPDRALYADLSEATGADPIDVRRAWGLQRFMENAARFGSRYPEKMRQLGSTYKGLMDRPLYLGGGAKSINFSEVLQTAPDAGGGDPDRFGVGDLFGHGIAAMRSNKYAHRVQEHGYIMSLLSVRPKTIYQMGMDRDFLKRDREDIHDPFLDLIGQQEVWDAEAYSLAANAYDTWGYTDRYDEYRQHNSNVSAEFRDILDYWHLARQYDAETPPVLNDAFIKCVPTKRVFNEQTQHSLWVMAHHSISAHRNLPKRATARLL